MTSYNFTLKNSVRKNGERSIIIQLVKDRKNTSLSISKSCKTEDWSFETSRVKKRHKNHKKLNTFIEKYEGIISDLIDEFELSEEAYDLNDLKRAIKTYKDKKTPLTFTDFIEQQISSLKKESKLGSWQLQKDLLSSLQKFFGHKKIAFKDINYNNLHKYVTHMRSKGNKDSTIGIRLRNIRASFNRAIKREIIPQTLYPFDKFKVSKYKSNTKKEFLTQEEIKTFKEYECQTSIEQLAKDMFLLSYYARGINFIDLILLPKSSMSIAHISYIRRKTNAHITFKMNDFVKEVIAKHKAPGKSKYILNIIKRNDPPASYIKNKSHKYLHKYINPSLKIITKNCGIEKHITYYCARHSFATALKFNNVSIEIIREALGHRDIKSTMSYLNTLPEKKLDNMIDRVIV